MFFYGQTLEKRMASKEFVEATKGHQNSAVQGNGERSHLRWVSEGKPRAPSVPRKTQMAPNKEAPENGATVGRRSNS